jgi:hypothetical protein
VFSSAGVTRYESSVNLVDIARLVAIGFNEDESKGNGRKEQRKRETNMASAGVRSLESQTGLVVRAKDGALWRRHDRAMSSLIAVP